MTNEPTDNETSESRRAQLLDVVRQRALTRFDEPKELASGELSTDFIDAKRGLSRGADLRLACRVIADSVAAAGIDFDAVGGLTLGADQFSHGVATYLDDDHEWFVVRKKAKGRGTDQLVEGAVLSAGTRVLLVDDVVTTGGSIQKAYRNVLETGATVVAAVTLVDRSDMASAFFDSEGVAYLPLFTYLDLGIDPIGGV
jgi:orotate phosphoribosyltransferase